MGDSCFVEVVRVRCCVSAGVTLSKQGGTDAGVLSLSLSLSLSLCVCVCFLRYGEEPRQDRISADGNQYLDAQFPGLSAIVALRPLDDAATPATHAHQSDDAAPMAPRS